MVPLKIVPSCSEGPVGILVLGKGAIPQIAGVAQSVEHLICNQRVRGSNPFASSRNEFSGRAAEAVTQQVF